MAEQIKGELKISLGLYLGPGIKSLATGIAMYLDTLQYKLSLMWPPKPYPLLIRSWQSLWNGDNFLLLICYALLKEKNKSKH